MGEPPRQEAPAVAPLRLVAAGAVANLAAGTLFAWSLVSGDAAAGVGTSPAVAAAVFATAVVVFAAVLLGVGPAVRRLGPRRVLVAAAVIGAAGLLLAAAATGPLTLWAGVALLFGAANGLAYGVAVGLAARVPPARRGTATGVVVAAYALGPVLLGTIARPALDAFGWRACLAVLAAVVAVLLVGAARLAPASTPASMPAVKVGGRTRRAAPGRVPARGVVLLWVVFAGGTAPALLLFAHAVPLAADRGLGAPAVGWAVSALAAGNLAGRLAGGWWSDRIGRSPALATALGLTALSVAGLSGQSVPGLVLLAFLGAGVAYGAVSSLVPAATADRVGADAFPKAYALAFTGWGTAGLLAPLAGTVLLRLQEPAPVLLALAALPLLPAALALVLLRERPAVPVSR